MPPGRKKRAAEAKSQGSPKKDRSIPIKNVEESSAKTKLSDRRLQSADSYDESHSDSSTSSRDKGSCDPSTAIAIRRPTYWLEMRGIKSSDSSLSATEGTSTKKRRLLKAEDEQHDTPDGGMEPPDKKQNSKSKGRMVRKDPPSYPAGSTEERWYLEILDRGKINCPTCRGVTRKTVEGLKKHMSTCREVVFKCQHCGKQLRSAPGMKYHIMADHNNMPVLADGEDVNTQSVREQLRVVLRQRGKLKCSREGCTSIFTSVVGYLYHSKKCGKKESELEEMALKCHNCGKIYHSRAGLMYHMKTEHDPVSYRRDATEDEKLKDIKEEQSDCMGRAKRKSAKVAIYHLHEIATEELIKEWPKRKVLQDLVPDDGKLKYSRPGLPAFSQEVIRKWRSEMKAYRRIRCPNKGCVSVYSSVSGLKAHLGSCTQGDFVAGKYKCLICDKEFSSESGVKYHINWAHCEEWFVVKSRSARNFDRMLKMQEEDDKKKVKKKKQATKGGKKKGAVKKLTDAEEELPRPTIIKNESERMRSVPSESDSESRASSPNSMEEEIRSVIWRARQPIVKPAALTPFKTPEVKPGFIKEAVLKPELGEKAELKPGLIKAAVPKTGLGKTTELKPGLAKTTTLKPGLIKAAVLKLDRKRK
ncbi:zinc finger protein 512 isoform X2 [Pleurodeles waltl]|uniref:zinc finger protein 512 isoform X2 n=1 Tax=Pleurodeles waltl TaxID=8319 RepID=UPI0037093AE6